MVSFFREAGDSDNENLSSRNEKFTSQASNQKKFGESDEDYETRLRMERRLGRIKHKIVVLSGKGGVGKSTVAVNLAMSLLLEGFRVGLLDIDIHGPSVPTMLGLTNETVQSEEEGLVPVSIGNLKVMSLGFLLKSQDDPVIWRGPMKMGVIKQFLSDVHWGDLDYLIIDSPPGTGDEPLSIYQLIHDLDGALIVTTPQKVASVDVRKSISFCQRLNLPVLGVIENMSGFTCPNCGVTTHIFPSGGGMAIARDMKVPFLGSIPMDPKIAQAGDDGRAYIHQYKDSETAKLMRTIIEKLRMPKTADDAAAKQTDTSSQKEISIMKIAIPLADGKLSLHFGHCEFFALVEVDVANKKILNRTDVKPPPHEPGVLPAFLAENGAEVIIAGGMGQRAHDLFRGHGITVLVGAPAKTPEELVNDYLAGTLEQGKNVCDH